MLNFFLSVFLPAKYKNKTYKVSIYHLSYYSYILIFFLKMYNSFPHGLLFRHKTQILRNTFSCFFFSWVSFARFTNCAFIHLFIFVIYKNVLIILIVTPGCMGNGLENFQTMVIPYSKAPYSNKNRNPLNISPEQHSSHCLGKINPKKLSFIVPERSANQGSQENKRNGTLRRAPCRRPSASSSPEMHSRVGCGDRSHLRKRG